MTGDQLIGGVAIAVFAPALGERKFLVALQQGETPDITQIACTGPGCCRGRSAARQGRNSGGLVEFMDGGCTGSHFNHPWFFETSVLAVRGFGEAKALFET
jgi:hypothetical protein